MALTTHTHVGRARLPRPAPGGVTTVPGEPPSRSAAGSEEPAWPTTQVWSWAQSVTLMGYGPPPSSFL